MSIILFFPLHSTSLLSVLKITCHVYRVRSDGRNFAFKEEQAALKKIGSRVWFVKVPYFVNNDLLQGKAHTEQVQGKFKTWRAIVPVDDSSNGCKIEGHRIWLVWELPIEDQYNVTTVGSKSEEELTADKLQEKLDKMAAMKKSMFEGA